MLIKGNIYILVSALLKLNRSLLDREAHLIFLAVILLFANEIRYQIV